MSGLLVAALVIFTHPDSPRPWTLTGHTDTVSSVTTTQLDGRPVTVSGSDDETIRVWGLTTRARS